MSGDVIWSARITIITGALVFGACGGGARALPDAGDGDATSPPADAAIELDAIPADAYRPPGNTLQVSSTGDDVNDGVIQPVRTLKRAVAIATTYPEITSITLAAARYSASTGEAFPYSIPRGVTVTGPVDGGAILVGDKTGSGLIVELGKLQNLEFENFATAIVARGVSELDNVRIRISAVAVRAEAAARLSATKLDVTGALGACATGIELVGGTALNATGVTSLALGQSLRVRDHGAATLAHADVIADSACLLPAIDVRSDTTFTLSDSTINGGAPGVDLSGSTAPLRASLTNLTVHDAGTSAVRGGNATVEIKSSALSRSPVGVLTFGGTWQLTGVLIVDNTVEGVAVSPGTANQPVSLTMRGCTVRGSNFGVAISDFSTTDLGTTASPGNNVFQDNARAGIAVLGQSGATQVDAVGNTWQPKRQGSDAAGHFEPMIVFGPIDSFFGNNFQIASPQWSVKL